VALYDAKLIERDAELLARMKLMSLLYPRFGYRRVAVMLNESIKRMRRLWRRHGFKLGENRPKRKRSRTDPDERPYRAEYPNHVWTYDIGRMTSSKTGWPTAARSECCVCWTSSHGSV
jgi:putative transposase